MATSKDFSILVKLMMENANFQQGIQKAQAQAASFEKNMKGMGDNITNAFKAVGGAMAAAFAVEKIVSFSKEAMKLAASAEGVQNAFAKIPNSTKLMDDLKKATRGVVEETDLMTVAIKAQNFKIPLTDLATYLEFATKRAIQTGESVNDLVDKIVMGVGRKAPKSFIALGISSEESKKAMKETGGVLDLIKTKIKDMVDVSDTAAIRIGRMEANVKNLKEAWGKYLNQNSAIQSALEGTALTFEKLADPRLDFWQKVMMSGKKYQEWYDEKGKYLTPDGKGEFVNTQMSGGRTPEQFNSMVNSFVPSKASSEVVPKEIKSIDNYEAKIKDVNTQINTLDKTIDKGLIISLQNQVIGWEANIKQIKEYALAANMAKGKADYITNPNKKIGTENINMPKFSNVGNMTLPNTVVPMNTAAAESVIKHGKAIEYALEQQEKLNAAEERQKEIFNTMISKLSEGSESFKDYVKVIKNSIREAIGAMIAEGVTSMILSGLKTAGFTGPLALVVAPALAALGAGLARTAFNSLIPSFAGGGYSMGGMALVGERGAELVNLPSGSQIFSHSQSQNMIGGEVLIKFQNGSLEAYMDYTNRSVNSYK